MPKPHLCVSVQCIRSQNRTLKSRFIFCESVIFSPAQAFNRRSSTFKPRPAHVGFVVRKGTLGRIFFPTTAGLPLQFHFRELGQLCPYSDSLRAGRLGDRVPVWGRGFPHPSRLTLGSTQSSMQWIRAVFPGGYNDGAWH